MSAGPFALSAQEYATRGWGPIPLPAAAKHPPPEGWTGYFMPYASGADIAEWCGNGRGGGNIGLRLGDVLGIDVDAYGDKAGASTLAEAEARLGPLPATWVSTSRDDGVSGIRLYRVADARSRAWADKVGPGIELLHHGHRYAVVAPSLHPEGGRRYVWIDPAGVRGVSGPAVSDLPLLPAAWVAELDAGPVSEISLKADVSSVEVREWLAALPVGSPCPYLSRILAEASSSLGPAGSRHDIARNAALAIIRAGEQGHVGAVAALDTLESLFRGAFRPGDRRITRGEWSRSVTGGVAICLAAPTAPANRGCCGSLRVGPTLTADDESSFWSSRPELSHLFTFARARMVSPWALLGVVLCRVVAAAPLELVLPKLVGSYGSLNLFVAIVGVSGAGKGTAEVAAEEALLFPRAPVRSNVGSGEGIAHLYAKRTKEGVERIADSVVLSVNEIDTLGALGSRQGSTLLPELRKAWSGEALGFGYADATKRLPILRGTYRMGLVAGVQPAKAGTLLNDADGGTPQRFVWLPSIDPSAPDVPPADPGPQNWTMPRVVPDPAHNGKHVIELCEEARDEIVVTRRSSLRGEETKLDGHLLYTRLKVAAALSLLEGRTEVASEDWSLSGTVMNLSITTRNRVEAALLATETSAAEGRAKVKAREAVTVAESLDESRLRRVGGLVKARLTTEWQTAAAIRRSLTSDDRKLAPEALFRLVEAGVAEAENGAEKPRYRAV